MLERLQTVTRPLWWSAVLLLAASWQAGIAVAGSGSEDNWPQWRGPQGTGVAPTATPPAQWSETKNVKWKVKIPGEGTATPIVWGEKVFVQAAVPTGKKADAAVVKSDPPTKDDPARGQTPSTTSRILDRLDTDKDGKISRAEIPEGTMRGVFDRLVERYKLDATKTYTRAELEKIMSDAPGQDRPPAAGNPGTRGNTPPRRPGGPPGAQGGPGGPGGMRSVRPTEPYQFVLICLDRQSGKELWQRVACEQLPHEGHHPTGSFAASSPVTDGKHVFAYFGSRGLYCYDMDGELAWKQDFGDMRIQNGFGEGSSPVLAGNAVIINWDHEGDSFIVALDKETGITLWKKPRDERTSWSTPILIEYEGQSQIVTAATRKVRSYDAASGALIWECSGLGPNTIPSPVAGDGMVFTMSGFRQNSLLAIRLGGTGDLSDSSSISWRLNKGTPYVPSPLLYDDRLYFFAGNNAILSCFDAKSGSTLFEPKRVEGLQDIYASPVGAAGRVYLVGRNGVTVVIRKADQFDVISTNRLDDRIDASPAIAGNQLFLRGHEYLYCIAED